MASSINTSNFIFLKNGSYIESANSTEYIKIRAPQKNSAVGYVNLEDNSKIQGVGYVIGKQLSDSTYCVFNITGNYCITENNLYHYALGPFTGLAFLATPAPLYGISTLYTGGGTTGATPTPQFQFNNYYDNAGDPSASHILLFNSSTGDYGLGISGDHLNFFSDRSFSFYDDYEGSLEQNLLIQGGSRTVFGQRLNFPGGTFNNLSTGKLSLNNFTSKQVNFSGVNYSVGQQAGANCNNGLCGGYWRETTYITPKNWSNVSSGFSLDTPLQNTIFSDLIYSGTVGVTRRLQDTCFIRIYVDGHQVGKAGGIGTAGTAQITNSYQIRFQVNTKQFWNITSVVAGACSISLSDTAIGVA